MSNHRRFFIEDSIVQDKQIKIVGATAAQIVSVLRLGSGDTITLFDGSGAEFDAKIISASSSIVFADVLNSSLPETEPQVDLVSVIGRSKPTKIEFIIQKCTELGVCQFIILECAYVMGDKPDEKKAARWHKIAIEATEQCGGTKVPQIIIGTDINRLAKIIPEMDAALLAHEQEKCVLLGNVLSEQLYQADDIRLVSPSRKRIMLITGPEGGFRKDEVDIMTRAGATSISLGPRILRAETAAIAGCATIAMQLWH